jgi:hypothetical protein
MKDPNYFFGPHKHEPFLTVGLEDTAEDSESESAECIVFATFSETSGDWVSLRVGGRLFAMTPGEAETFAAALVLAAKRSREIKAAYPHPLEV